jgi:2-succinyl-5-enolpyruvyl-6-hydroxy-3-cyclohexene-1-carboxylate synthase
MDERIRLSVNKMIVHKHIHQYLKSIAPKQSVKVELKEQEANPSASNEERESRQAEQESGEIKEECSGKKK